MKEVLFGILLMIALASNAQTVKDTINCGGYLLIIEVPSIGYKHSKIDVFEEVFFKTYPNIDTSYLSITCGAMGSWISLEYKNNHCDEYKEYKFGNILNCTKGSCNNKYFREDRYSVQNIIISYQNIDKSQVDFFDKILDNIIIRKITK